ncbi:MAG: protein kinase domain-containing protein [bacterium]
MTAALDRNPFVVGQWVRGDKFFGREDIIAELLHGPRHAVWVAALRRMGKTSLLRELERRTLSNANTNHLPLYWDLEGATNDETLRESLLAALDEISSAFMIEGAWEALSTPEMLRQIQKAPRKKGRTLLLLCDEAEALLAVARDDPHLLARLRRVLQAGENVRCILTATRRLARLETLEVAETSPFLYGFVPPLYLSPMSEAEVQPLLARAGFSPTVQRALYESTGGHPFLLQVLAKRALELGGVEAAFENVKNDETLQNFFTVDYNLLQPVEQALLRRCATGKVQVALTGSDESKAKQTLLALGLISEHSGMLLPRSPLVSYWLSALQPEARPAVPAAGATGFHALRHGECVGSYEILYEIARGGMGIVYCGRDVHLQRLAALKLLNPELVHDETYRARLLAEARAISQLHHPHIAMIYSVEFLGEVPCLCMEHVDGQRLDEWGQNPTKSMVERFEVSRQIASALAAAHGAGIIHRDLKPSNILVRGDGISKLLDFGIARRLSAVTRITSTGQIPGTLAYMSPEQVKNLDSDARSDVFSFGVVLYELFTGVRPFTGDNELALAYAIADANPIPPRDGQPLLPASLETVILRALDKTPEHRFADGREMLQALERVEKSSLI